MALFAPTGWTLRNALPLSAHEISGEPFSLRLYYKPLGIDVKIPLLFSHDKDTTEDRESLFKRSPLFPEGVIIYVKNTPDDTLLSKEYLFAQFVHGEKSLWLGFSQEFLHAIVLLFSGQTATATNSDALLDEVSRWFGVALGRPPKGFEHSLLHLSDRDLQWLLQWLLSDGIVSTDMLAAYLWSLQDNGKRLLDNLSQSVKREVHELMQACRRQRTYRWADEVQYLVHHNLFQHPRRLATKIRVLKTYADLRTQQSMDILSRFLHHAEPWHHSFPTQERSHREKGYATLPTKTTAAYGSFLPEEIFLSWWRDCVSQRGLTILKEDRQWWHTQANGTRSEEALHFLKQWFSLEAEDIVRIEDVSDVVDTLQSPWQIELITQEIGVANCMYALKPLAISGHLLPPIMYRLLEDVRQGNIFFHGWGDHRIPAAQKRFLTAVYVLRRLGRL